MYYIPLFAALKKKRTSFVLLFMCFLFYINAYTQPGFSQWYDFDSGASFHNVILKEDTLIIVGTTKVPITDQWGALFVKMDTLGNVLESKLHIDSSGQQYVFSDKYPIISTTDNGYAITGIVLNQGKSFLMKMDINGDVQFVKEYVDSTAFFIFPRRLMEASNGYLIAGNMQKTNFWSDWYLTKTDFNGNEIWTKYYGAETLDEGLRNFVQIDANEFVLTGSKQLYLPPYNDPDFISVWMVGIDSEGESLWEWQSDSHMDSGVSDLSLLPNGDWLYTSWITEIQGPNTFGTINKVIRRDSDFNLIWEKTMSPSSSWVNSNNDLKQSPEGNYIIASTWLMPQSSDPNSNIHYWLPACLSKITPEGDSIWSRCDTVSLPGNFPTGDHRYGGMVILPSGSIIAVGHFNQQTNPGKTWAWVVKVDKDGCLEELCVTTGVDDFEKKAPMRVFPNPVSEVLCVTSQAAGEWVLYDVWGREVKRVAMAQPGFEYEVAVAELVPGVYYYVLSDSGVVLGSGSIVVQ